MQLKVCGLKEWSNIEEVVALSPDYIGLIFYRESKRYVGDYPSLKTYLRKLTSVKKVGVFVDAPYEEVLETADSYALDYVQLHGSEDVQYCEIVNARVPVIKTFGVQEADDFGCLGAYVKACTFFLFDTYSEQHGGTGKQFDWNLLDKYQLDKPFFLSGGIGPGDVAAIKKIRNPNFKGIDVNSRFEFRPGYKRIDLLEQLIYEIRN